MKTKSVLLFCFVLAAVFSSSLVGYLFGSAVVREEAPSTVEAPVKSNTVSVKKEVKAPVIAEEKVKESEPPQKEVYILREDNGKIALFIRSIDGKERLHSSYDVPIAFLPKSDREKLKNGMEFNSLDEIVQFVEDYIS